MFFRQTWGVHPCSITSSTFNAQCLFFCIPCRRRGPLHRHARPTFVLSTIFRSPIYLRSFYQPLSWVPLSRSDIPPSPVSLIRAFLPIRFYRGSTIYFFCIPLNLATSLSPSTLVLIKMFLFFYISVNTYYTHANLPINHTPSRFRFSTSTSTYKTQLLHIPAYPYPIFSNYLPQISISIDVE